MKIMRGICRTCKFRHRWCKAFRHRHYKYPREDIFCKHWKLGKCYICKFVDMPDEEFLKRGCEAEYPGGCRKFERDWKKTFEFLRDKK